MPAPGVRRVRPALVVIAANSGPSGRTVATPTEVGTNATEKSGVAAQHANTTSAPSSATGTPPLSVRDSEPIELVLGCAPFLGLVLSITRGVMVPRTETELLARTSIDALQAQPAPRVIDMCCGAGNLAVAIAHFVPMARVWAADLTDACVETARSNVDLLLLSERAHVHQGDMFAAFDGLALEDTIDAIVCNPPYLSTHRLEHEKSGLLRHEPREAFDAGPYGLSLHRRALAEGAPFLRDGGWLICEFGVGQAKQIEMLFDRTHCYGPVRFGHDEHGEPRVAMAQRSARSPR